MAINFFVEDVDNFNLSKNLVKNWIKDCILNSDKKVGDINFIFCSDEYLRNINVEYLKHDYYTDIITFNYNEKNAVNGDIYICTDRVTDNAHNYKVDFNHELHRVMIHGVLHLLGFDDKSDDEKKAMRSEEDKWLSKFKSNS